MDPESTASAMAAARSWTDSTARADSTRTGFLQLADVPGREEDEEDVGQQIESASSIGKDILQNLAKTGDMNVTGK